MEVLLSSRESELLLLGDMSSSWDVLRRSDGPRLTNRPAAERKVVSRRISVDPLLDAVA
jgi:hypothetical protein